uniref:Peptidase A1 domain-containing protein n=1 Tax=Parastrongyloides trichosuri TaxID=131310 RepID=A0A0N4ZDI8_PARTI
MYFLFIVIINSISSLSTKHQLIKIESKREKLIKSGEWSDYFKKRQHSSFNRTLDNYYDVEYTMNISIGSPLQYFTVLPDVTTSQFWVPDINCGTNFGGPCYNKNKFDSSKSTTYNSTGKSFFYLCCGITGVVGNELISIIGDNSSFLIPEVTFGQAKSIPPYFSGVNYDGIFGLGFSTSDSSGIISPILAAYNRKYLDKPVFTIYLKENNYFDFQNYNGGTITFGNFDYKNCDQNISYTSLSSSSKWEFPLPGISVGGESIKFYKYWTATSDIVSPFIWGPPGVVQVIAQKLGLYAFDANVGFYVKCNAQLPDLNFLIGSALYSVPSKNMIKQYGPNQCAYSLLGFGNYYGNQWILGHPFIKSYCHIYDMEKKAIGFASPKY